MSIKDKFYKSVNSILLSSRLFSESSSFSFSGYNGPYCDMETPVRNTAHNLLSASVAYFLTGDKKYKEISNKLFHYLYNDCPFKVEDRYIMRQCEGKDSCNGVIGPAWIAESFHLYGVIFDSKTARQKAAQIIRDCIFDDQKRLWYRYDPILGQLSFDRTYNHQAYFAAVACQIDDTEFVKMVNSFLDFSLEKSFQVNDNGLIKHTIDCIKPDFRRDLLSKLYFKYHFRKGKKIYTLDKEKRDLGYHLYDLYALALLRLNVPEHDFWKSEKLKKSLQFVTKDFLDGLKGNKYAYAYNAPGFELPLISLAFKDIVPSLEDLVEPAFNNQIELTWNESLNMFCNSTIDPLTLNARIYELALYFYYEKRLNNELS